MFIRPPQFYPLPAGTPAFGCLVYIGLPNTDPTIEANKLDITNGAGGAAVANPYYINAQGKARNTNGEKISPYITENEYCIEFRSPNGALIDRDPHFKSDALGASGGAGSSVVDSVLDSFTTALITDMSAYNLVYIQSYAAGWEGTATGPVGGFYAYRTGSLGSAGTGQPGLFYDSIGNQFKPANFQRLYAEMFGAVTGTGNDSFTAIKNMIATAILLEKPCFLDGDEYYINTQSNVPTGYTLMSYYAIKITGNLAMYGNGNTIIKNTSANNAQYLFWAENVDSLVIDGLTLDGNSTNATTGALYCAGVTKAVLNCTIKNSGPLYLSGSTTRQTDTVSGDLVISGAATYAISGNSAGFKKLNLSTLQLISCAQGIQLTNADINAFAYGLTKPEVNIGSIIAAVTSEIFNCVTGSIYFGSIAGTVGTVFKFALGTGNVDVIKGSSISVTASKIVELNSTSNGRLTRFDVDNVYARSLTTGIQIDNAAQLIDEFRIGYIDIDGSVSAITIGDNTGLGKITINSGKISGLVGITINQTAGQKLYIRNVNFTGCTTKILNETKSVLIGEPVAQTITATRSYTFAHSLGVIPRTVNMFLECITGEAGYTAGDIVPVPLNMPVYVAASSGHAVKIDATNIYLSINTISQISITRWAGSGINGITDGYWKVFFKADY